mmetsp:Transcript_10761/g.18448  ORF Transcript_10761/g.18448 Transcript_10761/m.18448 type:complete len:412 (-) Transcript_10761:213-1448(-)
MRTSNVTDLYQRYCPHFPPESASAYLNDSTSENGHALLAEKFAADRPAFDAMAAKAVAPAEGTSFAVALIADQDEASQVDGKSWVSKLAHGKLVYKGDKGDASYALEMTGEATITTMRGDKSGRGAEYSALEVFDGKLLTMDDRTGNIDELVPKEGGEFAVTPLVDAEGKEVSLKLGDGKKDKPLKIEWATQKGGKLVIGSTGKERTDDDSKVVHHGEMWFKTLDPTSFACVDMDGTPRFNDLRVAAKVAPAPAVGELSAGYMIHESARWSEEHQMWLFMPRKLSRESYEEVKDTVKCVNLMLMMPDKPTENGSRVLMQPYLDFCELRGTSDFLLVPGTKDCHLFITRTEESLDGVISTFASVIDIAGKVLMKESSIGENRKFEGAAWVGGFGPFEGVGAEPSSPGGCAIM